MSGNRRFYVDRDEQLERRDHPSEPASEEQSAREARSDDQPTRASLVLDLQQSAGNASVSRVAAPLSRRPVTDAKESVGGRSGSVSFMEGGAGEENSAIAPGEKGFTLQMLKQVPAVAGKHWGDYADAHLHEIQPNVEPLDRQMKERRSQQRVADDEVDSWFTKHGIPSVLKIWQARAAGFKTQLEYMAEDRSKEQMIAKDFNAGVPRANQTFASLAKLEGMQEMLGVHDPAEMVSAVVSSLKDAQGVAEQRQLKGSAAGLDVPSADAQVGQAARDLTDAQHSMATAWIDVQKTLTLQHAADVKAEGKEDEKRQAEINENIETWRNIGTTIDVSMAVVGVDIAGETKGGGLRGFVEEGKGLKKEGEKELKRLELPEGVKETKEAVSKAVGLELPTSAGALLEDAAKIYYFSELENIRKHLKDLDNEVQAHKAAAEALGLAHTLAVFSDALDHFQSKADDLQKRLVARQMAYVKFGAELDEAAQQMHKGGAPPQGHERFATVMAVTSAVREVLAMGRGAHIGFGRDAALLEAEIRVITNHREWVPANLDPGQFQLMVPEDELAPLGDALVQLRTFEGNLKTLEDMLGPIDEQAGSMMTALNAGHAEAAGY